MCKTNVVFLFEAENFNNDDQVNVFAYFPDMYEEMDSRACYCHVGQHSICAVEYAKQCVKCDHESQYAELQRELESIGYNLNVLNNKSTNHLIEL